MLARRVRSVFVATAFLAVPAFAVAAPPAKPDAKPADAKPDKPAKPDAADRHNAKPEDVPPPTATGAEDKCVSPAAPEAIKEARSHLERANALYNDLDYKLALIEFTRGYERAPNCKILYNIGQVNLQLNNYAAALIALQRYLELAPPSEVSKDRRAAVERDIISLKARTAHLSVNANVAGAQVSLDDAPLGNSPIKSVLVDAGQHRVSVSRDGYQSTTSSVTLGSGEEKTVDVTLTKILTTGPGQIIIREHVETPHQPANYTWVGWTVTGVLAAGAITTGILAVSAKSDYSDKLGKATTADDLDSTRSKARTFGIVTDVLGAGALIAGGVSLYFTLKKPKATQQKGSADSSLHLGVGPSAVSASGTF